MVSVIELLLLNCALFDLICDSLFLLDIEKMVSIKGMIIRCSSVIPELKEAVFRCLVCGFYSEPVMVDRGMI
jgi:hypothetical protein